MRGTRAVGALCAVVLLGACGGSDEVPDPSAALFDAMGACTPGVVVDYAADHPRVDDPTLAWVAVTGLEPRAASLGLEVQLGGASAPKQGDAVPTSLLMSEGDVARISSAPRGTSLMLAYGPRAGQRLPSVLYSAVIDVDDEAHFAGECAEQRAGRLATDQAAARGISSGEVVRQFARA